MIPPIDISETSGATAPRHARQAADRSPAGEKNFASMLAGQTGAVTDRGRRGDGAKNADGPKHAEGAKRKDPIDAPAGEMWRPVRGDDDYARIMNGPRRGMYVNLSRGARRGEVFEVEQRDGHRVHVYGKGDKEKVVLAAKDSGKVHGHESGGDDARAARHPRNETWAPVKGANNYADILSGPRNGYYVNTSGGERDGMAFQIVKRGDHTYHVYGKGKNRQVVEVHHREEPKKRDADRAESNGRGRGDNAANSVAGTGGVAPDNPRRTRRSERD